MNKIKMIMTLALAMFSIMGVKAQASTEKEEVVFYESFDKMNGKGGNDGNWDREENLSGGISNTDNAGWVIGKKFWLNTAVFEANKCVLLGSLADLTTPALTKLSGDAILTFKAGATNNSDAKLKLSIQNGGTLDVEEIQVGKNKFTTYTVNIKGGTNKTKIRFEQTETLKTLLLDEVKIVKPATPTAISNIKGEVPAEAVKVYNLKGELIATSTKNLKAGVYVANGKKFVVK